MKAALLLFSAVASAEHVRRLGEEPEDYSNDLDRLGCPKNLANDENCLFHLTSLSPDQIANGFFKPHPKFFNTGNRYGAGLYVGKTPIVAVTELVAHIGAAKALDWSMLRVILKIPESKTMDLRKDPVLYAQSEKRNKQVNHVVEERKALGKQGGPPADLKYAATKQFKTESLFEDFDAIRYTSTQSVAKGDDLGISRQGSMTDDYSAFNIFGDCSDEVVVWCKAHGGEDWRAPWIAESEQEENDLCHETKPFHHLCKACSMCVSSIESMLPAEGVLGVTELLSTSKGICDQVVHADDSEGLSEGMASASVKAKTMCHEWKNKNMGKFEREQKSKETTTTPTAKTTKVGLNAPAPPPLPSKTKPLKNYRTAPIQLDEEAAADE